MNIAIVTGASSGMGKDAAVMIDKIYTTGIDEIWLVARREERLKELALCLKHKCRILPIDLTNEQEIANVLLTLELARPTVKMLVNASGYGVIGEFEKSSLSDQSGMVRLNCEALVQMTHFVLPYMCNGGRIIQFASSAAFVPQPDFSVYAASKSFVLSFSRALNEELRNRNISVTAVCPGPVNTEFFQIAEKAGTSFAFKKFFIANSRRVVKKALADSYHRRSVSVYSIPMKLFNVLMKIVPHSLVLKVMGILKEFKL